MKWLNDYVKADMPIKEFCDGMTMSGSKVETWTKQGADITNVVVGKCVAMEKHPDADTLWVCQIDVGKEAPVQIVTSAQNVFVGAFVPAALNNATCYNHKDGIPLIEFCLFSLYNPLVKIFHNYFSFVII